MMAVKRVLTFLLAVSLLGAAGCSSNSDSISSSTSSQGSSSLSSTTAPSSSTETEANKASDFPWWVGDEPITVTGMGSLGPLYVNKNDYNDIMGIQEFSKRTNLYFDWTVMTNPDNEKEQINLSFVGGKMPDIYSHIDKTSAVNYGEQGALIDLWPLIEEYAPNIKKALEADPSILPMLMNDGKLYMIPQVDADYRLASFKMFVIQQGWLDALSLEAPEYPDEFIEVLSAFQDNASKLTDQVMIPYSSYNSGNMEGWFDVFGWPFEMLSSRGYVKDDKIVFGVLEPEFKETLSFTQKLYSLGLIDPDLDANKDDATFEAKMTNNRVGIGYIGQGRFGTYNQKAGPTFENYEFVPMLSMKNADGKIIYPMTDGLGKNIGLAISINNKYPEETIKAWDYFYSEEGMVLMNFGIEGDTYEMVNGHYTYTDKIMKDPELNSNQTIMNYISPLFDWPTARIYDFERSLYGEKLAEYKEIQYEAGAYRKKVLYGLNNLPVTTAQLNEYAPISTDINTYINESLIKFIRSEWTYESHYDEFVSTLQRMGIQDLLNVLNEAYDKM